MTRIKSLIRARSACVGLVLFSSASIASGGVLDDCKFLFAGDGDKNGNGVYDDGEWRDRLHPGTESDVAKRAWDFPADAITWTNVSVSCNVSSNVLANEKCLYFHQKGTIDTVLKDAACALELPIFGYPEETVQSDQYKGAFTVLFRIKLPATDTKADGTSYAGSDVEYNSACGTIAAIGNQRTDKAWRGTDFRISHNPDYIRINGLVQSWNSGKLWTVEKGLLLTNAFYKVRDSQWLEVGIRGYDWKYQNNPAPGVQLSVWHWDGSSKSFSSGGRNGAPLTDIPFLLGNNSLKEAAGGFQGALHFVAAWKRTLTDDECMAAFKQLSFANDGNNSGLFKLGGDGLDGTRFVGETGGVRTMNMIERYSTDFPSNFVTGTSITLHKGLDAFTKNMKQILRLRTASTSATGRMAIRVNDTVLVPNEEFAPSKTYHYLVPASFFAGESCEVTLECLEAGAGGLRLATVELGGSWTIGLKDKSQGIIVPGQASTAKSTVRTYTVGVNKMTDFPAYVYDYDRNKSRSYTDIKFYVPEGLADDYRLVFKGSVYGGSMDPVYGCPHEYILNGTKHSERFFFVDCYNQKDYEMTIESADLTNGWNNIRCQNYVTNTMDSTGKVTGWRYTYWDYLTLQVTKRHSHGTVIILK